MDESFAAKNKCNPENHTRPFIIEWDATDMSSFESITSTDIVFVHYEGCDLRVLDACRNDSIRGEQGAYRPIEWTTGQLEKMLIANEGELYAKLPLGSASLGGRVAGGEKFAMEYYVAGTRNATRDAVYREDIAKNPACKSATHYVYGYNLGAFALGTSKKFEAEAGVSAFGFGAGGKTSSNSQVDKKGGDLGVCKSDSATEVSGCKAPIRLTLREIYDGSNPDKEAMKGGDTDASLNAAGLINAKMEMNEQATGYWMAAMEKWRAKDGKGCLSELDRHDKANPKFKSSEPKNGQAQVRAMCLMLTGKCDPGKSLMRKMYEQMGQSPVQADEATSQSAKTYCQGGLSPREELTKTYEGLGFAATVTPTSPKPTSKQCTDMYGTVKRLLKTVKPVNDEDDSIKRTGDGLPITGIRCLERAGDCKTGFSYYLADMLDKKLLKDQGKDFAKSMFESTFEKCKGKPLE